MIQDLSGSWCINGTDESIIKEDSPVPLMHHDPDRSWISGSPQRNAALMSLEEKSGRMEVQNKRFLVYGKYSLVLLFCRCCSLFCERHLQNGSKQPQRGPQKVFF